MARLKRSRRCKGDVEHAAEQDEEKMEMLNKSQVQKKVQEEARWALTTCSRQLRYHKRGCQ